VGISLTGGFPRAASVMRAGNRIAAYRAGIFRSPGGKADFAAIQFAGKLNIFSYSSQNSDNILKGSVVANA